MGNDLVAHLGFCFFIACTEVNAYLAMKYILKTDDKFMDFRIFLAKGLINNSYTNEKANAEVQKMLERDNYHTYWRLHLPMLLNTILKWVCTAKYKYQQ